MDYICIDVQVKKNIHIWKNMGSVFQKSRAKS